VPIDVLPRVGAGDPRAVQECLDRYGGLVWSLARRHSPTAADAEDAVQEVFLSLWKNASKFDPEKASEAGFITMVARRRLIDLFRGRQRRPQTQQLDAELEFVADARPLDAESRTEAGLAVKALGRLDPRERQVVLLSTYHGYSHSEIAELTAMPLGTVKTYIRRGLMRVREALHQGPRLEEVST
jgi:RNA polymerase sigma factor (sigma-70 family)